jgi:hypothetical protein
MSNRASKGFTQDPCPGCGARPTDEKPYWQRRKSEVCTECRQILDAHARRTEEVRARSSDEPRLYAIPEREWYLPYLREEYETWQPEEKRNVIRKAFHDLFFKVSDVPDEAAEEAVGGVLNPRAEYRRSGSDYSTSVVRLFRPSARDALAHLFDVVHDGLLLARSAGVTRGRSFLADLSEGKMSVKDFEARFETEGMKKDGST